MGLCISGKTTGESMSYSYGRLHYNTRFLALKYCGMPDHISNFFLGKESEESIHAYMSHMEDVRNFHGAIQLSGFYFPNLMMHSDCEGNYTKTGKDAPRTKQWMGGNSIKLKKELLRILEDDDLIKLGKINGRIKNALEYTQEFYDIVNNEIESGTGTIYFR